MQEITVTPLEALAQLAAVAGQIDTAECKDEGIYNRLQGAVQVAQAALAMAPKQEAPAAPLPEMTDDRIFEWAEGYVFTLKGMPHKMTFSRPRFVQAVRTIIAHLPAPAAANCAIPELPSPALEMTDLYTADQMRAYGQECAAAGPDAALIKAARNVVTCFNDPHTSLAYVARWVNELSEEIAALSGAKGN